MRSHEERQYPSLLRSLSLDIKGSAFSLFNFRVIKLDFILGSWVVATKLPADTDPQIQHIDLSLDSGRLVRGRLLHLDGHREEKWHRGQVLDSQGSGYITMAGPECLLTATRVASRSKER